MRLPIITRKKHEDILQSTKGRTIVYVPVDKETRERLKAMTAVPEKYAWHDGRIGWVERQEFDSYHEYTQFLKEDISYQQYLKRKEQQREKDEQPITRSVL